MVEKFRSDDQRGFTLIELLVTILIVAILSSAATSMFLHQRRKGWMAQVVSATKSLASVQEYWVNTVGTGGYTPNLGDLEDHGFNYSSDDVVPEIVGASSSSFCLEVTSRHDASIVWHYDSSVGRPATGPINATCVDTVLVANAASASATSSTSSGNGALTGDEEENGSWFGDGSESTSGGTTGGTGSNGGPSTNSSSGNQAGTSRNTTGSERNSGGSSAGTNGSNGSWDECDPIDGTSSDGDASAHPSGHDRSTENGGSGDQGGSEADPDGDDNGGADKPDGSGGADDADRDGNNGSGNDSDFEDDNRGPDGKGGGSVTDGSCTSESADGGTIVIPW